MTKKKLVLHSVCTLVGSGALILVMAPSSLANGELEVVASGDATNEEYGDSTIDVNEVTQDESGTYTSLTLSVNYEGDSEYYIHDANFYGYGFDQYSMSGVRLEDEEEGIFYYPLQDARDNKCLCAGEDNPEDFVEFVNPESASTYWASYILPKDLETVRVNVPGFEPVEVDIE